jgi:hypothetical protein
VFNRSILAAGVVKISYAVITILYITRVKLNVTMSLITLSFCLNIDLQLHGEKRKTGNIITIKYIAATVYEHKFKNNKRANA